MKQQPLVSIALCTYNGERYLAEQLDSVLQQSYPNIEVIIVDDCSTDKTYAVLQAYAAKHSKLQIYRNEENLGFTRNFEKAMGFCNGQLIALCDQDDIWHPDKILLQVNNIGQHIFIYHDSEFVHQDGSAIGKKMSDILNLYSGGDPEVFLFFNCVSGHSILMKRELIEAALPLKPGYFHDWWLAYVATNMGTIKVLHQNLVKYRQHDKSDTNILRLDRQKDNYKFSSVQSVLRTKDWLKGCRDFPIKKKPELIDGIYQAYKARINSYISFKLSKMLFANRRTIFFIQKKSTLSKVNFIYKQIWGSKTKAMFE